MFLFDLTIFLLRSEEVALAQFLSLFGILLRNFFRLTLLHHNVTLIICKLLLH